MNEEDFEHDYYLLLDIWKAADRLVNGYKGWNEDNQLALSEAVQDYEDKRKI